MTLHFLQKRCEDCGGLYAVRRPNRTTLIPRIVAAIKCPRCHPEALENACGGCGLPFSVVKYHGNGLCNACVVRELRYKARQASSLAPCPPIRKLSTA